MTEKVHMDDIVGAIIFLLNKPELTGAIHITSPNPARQAQFAHVKAASMHRPLFLTILPFSYVHYLVKWGAACCSKDNATCKNGSSKPGMNFIIRNWLKLCNMNLINFRPA